MTPLQPSQNSGLGKVSAVAALQMRVVSVLRFTEQVGMLPNGVLDAAATGIALCVGYKG